MNRPLEESLIEIPPARMVPTPEAQPMIEPTGEIFSGIGCLGESHRTLLNVTFDLPNLVIAGNDPSTPWEFAIDDSWHLSLMELKKKYFDQEFNLAHVYFVARLERDSTVTEFRPHRMVVRTINRPQFCSAEELKSVYTAVLYRITTEMDMYLRQHIHRRADPQIHNARLIAPNGIPLAETRASYFLPIHSRRR